MKHIKESQFWISESGARVMGRKEHGYFAVCSCGAEVYSGVGVDHNIPQPARLIELQNIDTELTPEQEEERFSLWKDWHAKQETRFEECSRLEQTRMREAIEKHALEIGMAELETEEAAAEGRSK